MSSEISLLLPDEVVCYLDESVATGRARSREALITRVIGREMRRAVALRDVALLREHGPGDDLDAVVHWTGS